MVAEAYALFEFGLVGPAEGGGLAHVEEFAGCAVGAGAVPFYCAGVADYFGDEFGQFLDAQFFACASVDGGHIVGLGGGT